MMMMMMMTNYVTYKKICMVNNEVVISHLLTQSESRSHRNPLKQRTPDSEPNGGR